MEANIQTTCHRAAFSVLPCTRVNLLSQKLITRATQNTDINVLFVHIHTALLTVAFKHSEIIKLCAASAGDVFVFCNLYACIAQTIPTTMMMVIMVMIMSL